TAAWQHLEDGRADHQAAAHHRRQLDGASGLPVRCTGRLVAGADACAQAAHARLGRARQHMWTPPMARAFYQDGFDRLLSYVRPICAAFWLPLALMEIRR